MKEHTAITLRKLLHEMAGKTYEERMRDYYGTTDDPSLGGYLLTDGEFLDFSEGGGQRTMDHRSVESFPISTWKKNRPNRSRWASVEHLSKKAGMYRWVPESWHLTMWTKPSREQLATIRQLVKMRDFMLAMEYRGKQVELDYQRGDDYQVITDIEEFFGI